MKITLAYSEDKTCLAYGLVSGENYEYVVKLRFDKLEIHLNKLLEKFGVCAEVVLHEVNEAIIGNAILDAMDNHNFNETVKSISHNINAETLDEYEKLTPICDITVYRNSDRLADIEGKRHKRTLNKIRKEVYN